VRRSVRDGGQTVRSILYGVLRVRSTSTGTVPYRTVRSTGVLRTEYEIDQVEWVVEFLFSFRPVSSFKTNALAESNRYRYNGMIPGSQVFVVGPSYW
jgi:hypothetical protein